MFHKLLTSLVCLVAIGCAGQSHQARQAQASSPSTAPAHAKLQHQPELPALSDTLAEADRAYDSQLGATRGQFDIERQIWTLQEAISLYRQFLERAEGRPELEPAVRKSRERIEDANATIDFLSASLSGRPQ